MTTDTLAKLAAAFSDQSTADAVEKTRRFIKELTDGRNTKYWFDDGFPRNEIITDARAALAVFEHLALTAQALPAAEPFGYFKAEPFGWVNCAETDDGAVALYERPASQFTGAFTGIAARKLAELADQGYRVNGYSLMHAETRARGFIDDGGFVGWWSNRDHEQAATPKAALVAEFGEHMAGYSEGFDDGKGVGERQAAQAPVGWQPMETAPKDRVFLGWVAAERWSAADGESSSHAHDTSQVDFCWWRNVADSPDGGYFDNASGQIGDAQDVTLWQPLPDPPAALPQPQPQSAQAKGDA